MRLWLNAIVLGTFAASVWACEPIQVGAEYLDAARMVLVRSLTERTPAGSWFAPDTMYVALVGDQDPPVGFLENLPDANLILEPWSKHSSDWCPNSAGFTFSESPSQDTVKTRFNYMRVCRDQPGQRSVHSGATVYGGADATVVRNGDTWQILAWHNLGPDN